MPCGVEGLKEMNNENGDNILRFDSVATYSDGAALRPDDDHEESKSEPFTESVIDYEQDFETAKSNRSVRSVTFADQKSKNIAAENNDLLSQSSSSTIQNFNENQDQNDLLITDLKPIESNSVYSIGSLLDSKAESSELKSDNILDSSSLDNNSDIILDIQALEPIDQNNQANSKFQVGSASHNSYYSDFEVNSQSNRTGINGIAAGVLKSESKTSILSAQSLTSLRTENSSSKFSSTKFSDRESDSKKSEKEQQRSDRLSTWGITTTTSSLGSPSPKKYTIATKTTIKNKSPILIQNQTNFTQKQEIQTQTDLKFNQKDQELLAQKEMIFGLMTNILHQNSEKTSINKEIKTSPTLLNLKNSGSLNPYGDIHLANELRAIQLMKSNVEMTRKQIEKAQYDFVKFNSEVEKNREKAKKEYLERKKERKREHLRKKQAFFDNFDMEEYKRRKNIGVKGRRPKTAV